MTWKLIWPVLLLAILPIAASILYYGQLPAGFGVFPPLPPTSGACIPGPGIGLPWDSPPMCFLWWYFAVMLLICLAVIALFLLPKLFGFKGSTPLPPAQKASFPVWGWIGAAVCLFFWFLMWGRFTTGPLAAIVPYAFTPMWWGFIFFLDGLVYARNNGVSLFSSKPKTLLLTAAVSLFGWLFFEFFDYFVNESWGYPNTAPDNHVLPHAATVAVFLIAYTTVWPAVFEWYNLLNTFTKLPARYQNGPKWVIKGSWLMILGFACMVIMTISPDYFFWMVWIGPFAVFSGILVWLNIPNPFNNMAQGNWAPVLLIALACFINGFFWEVWNYGSANPELPLTNPNYWKYYIPYVNVFRIYAEMPILGYFGYMPFGVLCWQLFIWTGKLFKFDSDFTVTASGKL